MLEKFKWILSVENFCSITPVNLQSVSQEVSQGRTPKHSVLWQWFLHVDLYLIPVVFFTPCRSHPFCTRHVEVCFGKLRSCSPQSFLIPCLCLFYYSPPKLEAMIVANNLNRMITITDWSLWDSLGNFPWKAFANANRHSDIWPELTLIRLYTKWVSIAYFSNDATVKVAKMPHPSTWRKLQLWFLGSVNPWRFPGATLIPSFNCKKGEMLCLQRNLLFALHMDSGPVSITPAAWHSWQDLIWVLLS